jgi:hypothetical protein
MEGNKDNSGFNAVFGGGGGGTTPPTTIFEYGSFHSQKPYYQLPITYPLNKPQSIKTALRSFS